VQTSQTLKIGNGSAKFGTDLAWSVSEAATSCSSPSDVSWLSASPSTGTTTPGASDDVAVGFDSAGLAIGTYSAKLCVTSNDPDTATLEIPVTLTTIYRFSGFFGPLAARNFGPAGSILPVIFSLDGNEGLSIFAAGYPKSQRVDCATLAAIGAASATTVPGGSGLSYDGGSNRYTYPWQTSSSWKNTCRQFMLGLNDGTVKTAVVQFAKS
jgi:hypothetical protein